MSFTISKYIPGLALFRDYPDKVFPKDLLAGLSVAAVAIPIGIAYAQLAGFPPVMGIYSAILPAMAYAFFGSSRQLVVNPDSAVCMMIVATVSPLAMGDTDRYIDLSILLTFITGILCLLGGFLKLGVIANFLSRPILTGYLNGIALSIIASQLGTLLGFKLGHGGFFYTIWQALSRINETHLVTLLMGLSLFALIRLMKHYLPLVPAPLVAIVLSILLVQGLALTNDGVATVGTVPAGFPGLHMPAFTTSELPALVTGGCGIVLVSFCSMMTTARAFAVKNGYDIRVNQDMAALGVCDLASAFCGGFAVSGADSRTAIADTSGGRTQLTSIVAAFVMMMVLLFLTAPLASIPAAALAAILIASAMGLFDIASLRRYYYVSKVEFRFSLIATLGVMTVGVLPGVLVAVALSMLKLLRQASNPHDAILNAVEGQPGVYASKENSGNKRIPGLLIYRFDSAIVFFNADYLKNRIKKLLKEADTKPSWFIFDCEAVSLIDITGCDALEELRQEMKQTEIILVIVRAKGLFRKTIESAGLVNAFGPGRFYYSIQAAVDAFHQREETQLDK